MPQESGPPAQPARNQPATDRPARADARRNRARILAAAGTVFAEHGASASTEAVAQRAGVAIGTVFRHFPTKPELLAAVAMNLLDKLVTEVDAMVEDPGAATALFPLCTRVMEVSVQNREVFARITETGTRIHVGDALARLRPAIDLLLGRARQAGAVREDLQTDELILLLAAICQEAMTSGWSEQIRQRALNILFDGMRPASQPRPA